MARYSTRIVSEGLEGSVRNAGSHLQTPPARQGKVSSGARAALRIPISLRSPRYKNSSSVT